MATRRPLVLFNGRPAELPAADRLTGFGAALAALDALTPAADRLPYFTSAGAAALATFTPFGRTLVDDADAAAARATLGLGTMATAAAADYARLSGATFTGDVFLSGAGSDLQVSGIVGAGQFIGNLTGNADTAGALGSNTVTDLNIPFPFNNLSNPATSAAANVPDAFNVAVLTLRYSTTAGAQIALSASPGGGSQRMWWRGASSSTWGNWNRIAAHATDVDFTSASIGAASGSGPLLVVGSTSLIDPANIQTAARGTLFLQKQNPALGSDGDLAVGLAFSGVITGRRRALIASYQDGAGQPTGLAFYTYGVNTIPSDAVTMAMRLTAAGRIEGVSGSDPFPTFGFISEQGLGMYRAAAATLAWSGSSVDMARLTAAGFAVAGRLQAGTTAAPSLGSAGDAILARSASQGAVYFGTNSSSRYLYGDGVNLTVGPTFTSVRPNADNSCSMGTSGLRWSVIYSATAAINTSDNRMKTDVADVGLGLDFIEKLRPVRFRWIVGSNSVDAEGRVTSVPGKRIHMGFMAQDVKAAIGDLDAAIWILGNKADPTSEQGLRYEHFIAPLTKAAQELSAKVKALQAENAGLVARLLRIEKLPMIAALLPKLSGA